MCDNWCGINEGRIHVYDRFGRLTVTENLTKLCRENLQKYFTQLLLTKFFHELVLTELSDRRQKSLIQCNSPYNG